MSARVGAIGEVNTGGVVPDHVADGRSGTMPLHIWKHETTLAAIHGGATAKWLDERFGHRLADWFDAGETVFGAVEMILFTLGRERSAAKSDSEVEFLRLMLKPRGVAAPREPSNMERIAADLRNGTFRGVPPETDRPCWRENSCCLVAGHEGECRGEVEK